MNALKIDVKGAKDFAIKLGKLKGNVAKKILRKGMRAAAKLVKADATRLAPKRTGKLSSNSRIKALKRKRGRIGVRVTNSFKNKAKYYGQFMEYGWTHHGTTTSYEGQHYMKRAGQMNRQRCYDLITASLDDAIRSTF